MKVAIIGASGYLGTELVKILLSHGRVNISTITSRRFAGKELGEIKPGFKKITDLKFSDKPIAEIAEGVDLMFFALPHGIAMNEIPKVIGKTKVIDLSGDYRIKNLQAYQEYYGLEHSSPNLLEKAVYGLPEFNREKIKKADLVANPGCFSTAVLLALIPLAKENMLKGNIVVDAKTGSSGLGAKPSATSHHPERSQNFKAYKAFTHQHTPEILQQITETNEKSFDFFFVPHSAPMVRGIFSSAYLSPEKELSEEELRDIYLKYYGKEFFIRLVEGSPENINVKESNFCDIGFKCKANQIAVFSAIDNLVKGGAGQAVQNMNLMLGFKENTGLLYSGSCP